LQGPGIDQATSGQQALRGARAFLARPCPKGASGRNPSELLPRRHLIPLA